MELDDDELLAIDAVLCCFIDEIEKCYEILEQEDFVTYFKFLKLYKKIDKYLESKNIKTKESEEKSI